MLGLLSVIGAAFLAVGTHSVYGKEGDGLESLSKEQETFLWKAMDAFPKAPVVESDGAPDESDTTYHPVVLMHGLGDAGDNPGMQSLAQSVMDKYKGSYAVAVDVADGIWSFITSMQDQVDQFTQQVRSDPKLANGFDLVGLSQGGLVARAYIHMVNDPPVRNFVSICGVVGGVSDCPASIAWIPFLCDLWKSNPYDFDFGILPISFADYWVADNATFYFQGNKFLAPLNNVDPYTRPNATYKTNFVKLEKLRLIAATEDTVVYPWQAEQFGGWVHGHFADKKLFNMTQSTWYQQDSFGLRTLDHQGKISMATFDGDHLRFNNSFWNEEVLPYLAKPN